MGRKETYVEDVCNTITPKYKTQGVRTTSVGNLVEYKGYLKTPTANVFIINTHRKSIISDKDSNYIYLDVK